MKKKLVTLLLAGCMVFSLAACGNTADQDTADNTQQTEQDDTADAADDEESAIGTSKLIELGEYKGLTYIPADVTVTDEEVEEEVQKQVSTSTVKNPKEIATETCVVNIDYVGKKDDVAFDGGTAEGYELDLANSNFIEGFAESIVGMKVGETKDCPMTFPEDYHAEELAGAEVVFTITVNECWENVPAELNAEFAESKGYDSVDALYAGVREELETTKADQAENAKRTELIDQLIASSTFDITEDEIQEYVDSLYSQYEMYASYFGYDLETYVTATTGLTFEAFQEQCREESIYRIQSGLLQTAIAEKEGIVVSEEEYTAKAEEYMVSMGYSDLAEFEEVYTKEIIEKQVIADMALEIMIENAVAGE